MRLPEKFYLGFDRYQTEPPEEAAAVPLGHQLKAIEWVIMQLIEKRAFELRSLTREELPTERGAKGAKQETADASKPGKGSKPLVLKNAFEVVVLIEQNAFANLLNTIVSPQAPQFYVPRLVTVKNEKEKGPPKVAGGSPSAPPAINPDGTPVATAAAPAAATPVSSYIVGEEKIEVTLRLEIVDFTETASK